MEQRPSGQAQPDYSSYDPYLQHHEPERGGGQGGNSGWDPMAPTPDPTAVSPASPPEHSQVSFAPVSSPSRETAAGATGSNMPSSVGLGIESSDGAPQFPGYRHQYYAISRDSLQQDSDSPSASPPPVHHTSKSNITAYDYPVASPDGTPYYFPHPYDGAPPGGQGNSRLDRLRDSTGWRMASSGWRMYVMFFLGLAFAIGHHAFYTSLDGKLADDQIRMMRFGGLLSYAAKASLVAAVVFAYQQQIWVTVIHNTLRLRTIDSLFAGVNEPQSLLNWEFVTKARVAVCLAGLAWLFPLTVILTPATLTVAPRTEVKHDQCYGVRTLNFEAEKDKNWRMLDRLNGYRRLSLSLWNSTVADSVGLVDTPFNETFFDYWTESSAPLDLVTAQSALTGTVIPRRDVALETCGGGWNCSYTISFKAPGYKCSELARGRKLDEDALKRQGVPFNAGELVPNGNFGYIAVVDEGEYASNQLDVLPGGMPKMKPPYPKHLGAFRTEPVLWIGYSEQTTPGKPPENRTAPGWDTAFEAAVFRCEHYLTNYTVQFNHTFSGQTAQVVKRDYLHPIIDTQFVPNRDADDGTKDNTTATPQSNYVLPLDVDKYRITAGYHSLGKRMRAYINGQIQYTPYAMVESDAANTRLINTETYLPVPNLMSEIRAFYENMTLSLLSNPQFLIVSWAAQPDQPSGVTTPANFSAPGGDSATAAAAADDDDNDDDDDDVNDDSASSPNSRADNDNDEITMPTYPCTRTRVANAYVYNQRDLWIAYAAAVGAALFAVVLGSAALAQNDFRPRDTHVSSLVAATRAPHLDALPWNSKAASKWGEVPPEVLDVELRYGVVVAEDNGATPGLGMWMGAAAANSPGRSWWSPRTPTVSGRLYYGFAPSDVLERTRAATFGPGKPRNRLSAFSFNKNFQEHDGRGP
ncbi:Formylmethionine deformylase-like protein [Corynascus novoguineensis]|uniref:Formylmethionine deformylase-like protein n=1 Tax=Corynascus novoguineensis TaxID=1126955 RepID=A0AAN7HJD9_9PEZI|nr:Formylmethionine deformylase-like protein [Corynascus novoguineensis]